MQIPIFRLLDAQPLPSLARRLLLHRNSGPPRGWPPVLARRGARVLAAPDPPIRRLPRLPHISREMARSSLVEVEEFSKQDRRLFMPSANGPTRTFKYSKFSQGKHFPITRGINNEDNMSAMKEFIACHGDGCTANCEDGQQNVDVIYGDGDASRTIVEVTSGKQDLCEVADSEEDVKEAKEDMINLRSRGARVQSSGEVSDDQESCPGDISTCYPCDCVANLRQLQFSSHRDGSIYRDDWDWKRDFRTADRNETLLEEPSNGWFQIPATYGSHRPCEMWQVFSLKLVKIPMDGGHVELYGYIAVRDHLDPLLNYIVHLSRDDPITVEQGSLIEMTGPKRGISLTDTALIEYDMRIKTGGREEDDLQLIDGAAVLDAVLPYTEPVTSRIHGNNSAVDITEMCLSYAVDATVEVVVSEVHSCFDLSLSCFTSGLQEEIRLFDGVIVESRGLRRYVIAVEVRECLDLTFKVGSGSYCSAEERFLSFEVMDHGCASQQIKTKFASIFVKVTWPTVRAAHMPV